MERMELDLGERVSKAIFDELMDAGIQYIHPRRLDSRAAGAALAALGLDDLNAAVERAAGAIRDSMANAREVTPYHRKIARAVLEAALTATPESEESDG